VRFYWRYGNNAKFVSSRKNKKEDKEEEEELFLASQLMEKLFSSLSTFIPDNNEEHQSQSMKLSENLLLAFFHSKQ